MYCASFIILYYDQQTNAQLCVCLLVIVKNAVLTVYSILNFKVSTKTCGARHRLEMSVVFSKCQAAHVNQMFQLCLVQN
jgi:hypothetical protein